MLMTLIKKQFRECFRGYFVNRKTGKLRSKWGLAGLFVLFASLMMLLCTTFFGVAFILGDVQKIPGMSWLFYALMGILAIMLGTFGSVFNTYSTLYVAKDNELLLSMPIPPVKILLTRLILVYGLSLMYSGIVWVPAIIHSWIFTSVSAVTVLFQILLTFVIALFVTVLTCILGWVVALVASRTKNKNILTVLISLAFLGGYYYFCANMTEYLAEFVKNAAAIGNGVRTWANVLYQLGQAADGDGMAMLIFTGLTLAGFVICFFVMERSFLGMVTRSGGVTKKDTKITVRSSGLTMTLFRRELKKFTSNTSYMLNCGMSIIMLLVFAGSLVVKKELLLSSISGVAMMIPGLSQYLPIAFILIIAAVAGMGDITAPSVSLEGQSRWILHSLPISGAQVLRAKLTLHVVLNSVPALIAVAAAAFALKMTVTDTLMGVVYVIAIVFFTGAFGLLLDILHPNFQWTSEIVVIKQSLNVLFCLVAGFLLPIITGAACFLLSDWMDAYEVLTGATVLTVFADAWLVRWLLNQGAAKFEAL